MHSSSLIIVTQEQNKRMSDNGCGSLSGDKNTGFPVSDSGSNLTRVEHFTAHRLFLILWSRIFY